MIVQRTAYGVQRVLFVAVLLPIGAFAQLQLLQVNGTTETPVGASYDAGSAAPGDTLDIRFRIKNLGAASTAVQTIAVAGTGFKLSAPPLLPYTLATQAEVEFHVAFSPPGSGSFSATLALNTIVVTTIRATALPGMLLSFNGTTETPVGATYDAGSVAPGDTLDIRFRIKNLGTGSTTVQTITVAGTGFKLSAPPLLPYTLAPQAEVEFHVSFSPPDSGPFSATLAVNTIVVSTIRATGGAPGALLSFGTVQLAAGATADFGQIEIGTTVTKTFTLTNSNGVPVSIGAIAVTGGAFQGPSGVAAPLQLAAGASADFQIAFAPQLSGQAKGTLTVDQRTFNLTGLGLVPPLPKGTIVVTGAAGSAQQAKVSVALASASKVVGTGTLSMQFIPAAGLPDDAAIQFLSGAKRSATVTIAPGDSSAKFGGQPDFAFQTGTTAGSIAFTLTLPNSSDQYTLPIAPALVGIDTATGERRVSDLDVNLAGFDNTHSISQLGFTFYDTKGSVVQPGLIRIVSPPEFKQYFAASQAGGAFTMRASFPVTGDATQISGVDVQVTNSAGTASTQRVRFP